MRAALGLARRGLGQVWPNPAVGCILVKDGIVVGRGWTQPGGRPHAETEALRRARAGAVGATCYVTLEPCSHTGLTGPCADALAAAGVVRVVAATEDPDPRVSGRGFERLRAAGITVEVGLCRTEAEEINAGFFMRIASGRPIVTLKTATSLDGRIATHSGDSRWISSEDSRAGVHHLRAEHDAVLVGANTALNDDPLLTCRLPGLEDRRPVRVVVDSRLRLPLTHKLVASAREIPVWLVCAPGNDHDRRDAFTQAGVQVIEVAQDGDGSLDIRLALQALGQHGLTRILVEGGGHVAAALLRANLVDRLVWYHAPLVLGGDGLPAVVSFGVDVLADAPRFRRLESRPVGDDTVAVYARS
jgi:diaminohydroxyphosphoribosylaminopyrimidine deaminase/5-amino-6-(5-phosphoribosylamino)uracil reductase